MIKVTGALLLLLLPFYVLSQAFRPDPDWRFENFNSQNHFVNADIADLCTDKHGYLWASSMGLDRFDGYKTSNFNSFNHADGALRANGAVVMTDRNGLLWVGSSGLGYYDEASGKFVYIKTDAQHTITYAYSFCMQKNYLWFICDHGLAKVDICTKIITFTSLTTIVDALYPYLIDENTLLISSRTKIYIYNTRNDTYTSSAVVYNHSLLRIYTVTRSGSDIYLGTNRGLFYLKNLKDISPVCNETAALIDDMLFMPQDKERKHLLIATDGKGIMVFNTVDKKVEFIYAHDESNPYSLQNNIVSRLYADKQGRLWVGTASGVSMLDMTDQRWKMRFLSKNNTDETNIVKIVQDRYDTSKVWMSSYNRGLIRMDWPSKNIEKIVDNDPDIQKIIDCAQVSKNKWLLVSQKKIIEWDQQQGILSKVALPVPEALGLICNIRRIIMAGANTCYITTNRGLFKYDLARHKTSIAAQSDKPKDIEDRKYDLLNGFNDNGVLWIASRDGLFSYDIAKSKATSYNGPEDKVFYYFFDVANAPKDQVICAAGNGIAIFNKTTKSFKLVSTIANLYRPSCSSVICVKNLVWINTDAGMLTYNIDTQRSATDENETSLVQLFPGSPFTVINNDIVLGFRNGYAYFLPHLNDAAVPSDPIIESVRVNNQAVLPNFPEGTNEKKLVLDPQSNSINIAFTAFLYDDPAHIKFRYRLKGADPKWQYTDDQRSANYAQLPPGDYTFYVQSGNKNGIWNSDPASFSFMIEPPYWAAWWFRLLVFIGIMLALYGFYKYRITHLLAIQRIRERIASDFHDDIGSALSSISIFSEVADKQLQQNTPPAQTREIISHISYHSRAMLDAMDDIIWAVNPQNDHFNDLAVRMREFAIPLLEASNINFEIDIQEEIMDTRLKMETRKNIFMIFKECINNILRHANCTAMAVAVSKINNQLQLTINDNGKGFDMQAPNTRNGLKNMRKRAAEIRGTITIISKPGNGTQITLIFNII